MSGERVVVREAVFVGLLQLLRQYGVPTLGPLDLSPIVAVIVLLVAARALNALIGAVL